MCEAFEGMNVTLCSGHCAFVESQNHKERPGWGCLESVPCAGPGWSSYSHLDVFVDLPSVLYRQSPKRGEKSLQDFIQTVIFWDRVLGEIARDSSYSCISFPWFP